MNRFLLYFSLVAILASCAADLTNETNETQTTQHEMQFRAMMSGLSRATGIYSGTTYPVNRLYLTAFHLDSIDERRYYFKDKMLDYEDGVWKAPGWYWPLQGDMAFLSYYCPSFSIQPTIDEMTDAEGKIMPRMVIDGTTLDGQTDFIFLSHKLTCPQPTTAELLFTHGLAWITVSLKAEVYDEGSTSVNASKTEDLMNHLKVHKVVIEDCARKGIATVMPGSGIIWKTYDDRGTDIESFIRDQVYYNDGIGGPGTSDFTWHEIPDASTMPTITTYLPITAEAQPLGKYTPTDAAYLGEGVLIVPQKKTAITVEYTVTDSNNKETYKVERFELRDNPGSWMAGYNYNYEIIFRNYDDYDQNFEVVPTWSGVYVNNGNFCYDDGAFGKMNSTNNPSLTDFYILIEPIHNGGSGLGDEMDYPEGPTVF